MKIILMLLLLLLTFSSQANEKVKIFANKIVSLIASSNIDGFKKLPCYPTNCTNSKYIQASIFGNGIHQTQFEKILADSNLRIKVISPAAKGNKHLHATYVVVFYSSKYSPFDISGNISIEYGYKELYSSFLQTSVSIHNGNVGFNQVPFYLESHHPYVEDYG